MRSKLFASGLAIVLGVGSPIVGAMVMHEGAIAQTDEQADEQQKTIAETLLQQCLEQFKDNQFKEASQSCERVLSIYREIDDKDGQDSTLTVLGSGYIILGEPEKIIEYYQTNLSNSRATNNQLSEAIALNRLGGAYSFIGSYGKAVEYYQKSLLISRGLQQRVVEAVALHSLGSTYQWLGDYTKALEYHQESLKIMRELKNKIGEASALHFLGITYYYLKNYDNSIDSYEKSLEISSEINYKQLQSRTTGNLGYTYQAIGNYSKAINFQERSLEIALKSRDRVAEGYALGGLGLAYQSIDNYTKSLTYYEQALVISRHLKYPEGERIALSKIASVLKNQKQPELAIVFYKKSINVSESIRKDNRILPKEIQQTYTTSVEGTYRELADLLLKVDRILEAQQVLDLLKVQELNTYLKNVRGASQPLETLPPETEILKKYTVIQTSAIALGQERTTLLKVPEPSRTPQQTDRIAKLTQLQEDLNQQFNQFTDRPDIKVLIESLSPKVRRQTVDTADLDALRSNLKQLNAVMIYPLILDDRLELIITTPDSPPLRRTVNVKREDLNKTIVAFRSELSPNGDSKEAKLHAQKLYNWLIKPLEADLKTSNPKTLIYAPDGQLRYIPIGALHDGKQWLTERYAINLITAKSLTNLTQQPRQQPKILAGAIGGKESDNLTVNVGTRSFSFAGLPFTNTEIDAIQSLQPNTQALKEKQFTLAAIKPKFADYNILHLATHAAIIPVNPENSFILFGGNTTATLRDIENWTLSNFDLVVLSACETGLAGNFGDSNGEEILGLGYQFQSRGAKATIASLWRVADDSTQELMTEFYKALKSGQPKAQALQTAQRALIGKKDTKNPDFNQPYHWASFILIGNGL
jgi:CHAT domain-containing protein